MKTVEQVSAELADAIKTALATHLPRTQGYSVEVALYENKRRKRRDASRDSWSPGYGEIRISFGVPTSTQVVQAIEEGQDNSRDDSTAEAIDHSKEELIGLSVDYPVSAVHSILHDEPERNDPFDGLLTGDLDALIESLDRAEKRPGFQFVALKWFRDKWFPDEDLEARSTTVSPDDLIRRAIAEGIASTNKVPNPITPEYPVTAIRLNRQHAQVVVALGAPARVSLSFYPIDIHGEPLSETVIRERR